MSIVKINAIEVPESAHDEFQEHFIARRQATVEDAPGFLGFKLLRPANGETRFFVITEWTDERSFDDWNTSESRRAHMARRGPNPATGTKLLEFDVVLDVSPNRV